MRKLKRYLTLDRFARDFRLSAPRCHG